MLNLRSTRTHVSCFFLSLDVTYLDFILKIVLCIKLTKDKIFYVFSIYIYTSFCKNHLIIQATLLIHCFKMCVWASIYWSNSKTLAQPIRKLKSLFCCFLVHSYFFRFTGNPWIFDHFWTYYFTYVVAYRSTRPLC